VDPTAGEIKSSLGGEKEINSVAFSPDGSLIAAGDGAWHEAGTIRLYNTATGDPFGSPLSFDGQVESVDWSPCGNKLSAACNDVTGRGGHPATPYSVQIFSQEGSTGNFVCQSTLRSKERINCVAFSPDGSLIAAGDGGPRDDARGTIRLYDVARGVPVGSPLRGHRYVLSPMFSPILDLFEFCTGVKYGCFWVYIHGGERVYICPPSGDFTGLVKPGFENRYALCP